MESGASCDPVMPIARLPAAVHDRINGDALVLRLPTVINDEWKPAEDVAPNLGLLDHAPPRRRGDQSRDCGLDARDESVSHPHRGFVETVVRSLLLLKKRLGMKTVGRHHQLAVRAEATMRRTCPIASSPGISETSPDSTCAIRRRTSAV